MFPISLLPFHLDSALLSNIFKSFLFLNPSSLLISGVFILAFLSLKTLTAKLTFLGVTMFVSSLITYIAYKKDQKENSKQKNRKSFVEYLNNQCSEDNIHLNNEEKELMLSKIFKK